MEDVIKYKSADLSNFHFLNFGNDKDKDDFLKTSNENEELEQDSLTKLFEFSPEDSGSFLKNVLRDKETIINENWKVNENIQGIIISYDKKEVFVDCLIDQEKNIIQSRRFPISLFKNLSQIDNNKPVLIKTRLKPGAIRIDVYAGEGIVNLEVFKSNDQWDSLKGKNLDSKLTEW